MGLKDDVYSTNEKFCGPRDWCGQITAVPNWLCAHIQRLTTEQQNVRRFLDEQRGQLVTSRMSSQSVPTEQHSLYVFGLTFFISLHSTKKKLLLTRGTRLLWLRRDTPFSSVQGKEFIPTIAFFSYVANHIFWLYHFLHLLSSKTRVSPRSF